MRGTTAFYEDVIQSNSTGDELVERDLMRKYQSASRPITTGRDELRTAR